jgi:uncharacterized protein YdhG (YjbR/CyaY superfamily)
MARFQTIDEYIAASPEAVRPTLEAVRRTIREAAPGNAHEGISYGIPAIGLDGEFIVWFAAWTRHISLYPIPAGDAALSAELAPYRAGRGTLKFPLAGPIPLDVIGRVAAELVRERLAGAR